jgi:protein arginine kinase activator
MKCQRCTRQATHHITEILGDDSIEQIHLCPSCADSYLKLPIAAKTGTGEPKVVEENQGAAEEGPLVAKQCPSCGLRFVDYRNTSRLGCPQDYIEFRDELVPLLESIHGERCHVGKVPSRLEENQRLQAELAKLRKDLAKAISTEKYEDAARLRDAIRKIEMA